MRKIWMAIFCFVLMLFFTEAYATQETGMQTALLQSQWSGCTLLTESRDGDLCAGIAVDPATGRKSFVIAQRKDGVFTVTACYENAIPHEWDTNSMQVEVHDTGEQYLRPNAVLSAWSAESEIKQYARFVQSEEGNWTLSIMQGDFEGGTYFISNNPNDDTMTLSKHSENRATIVTAGTFDTTQQGFSFHQMLGIAKNEIEKDKAQQIALITQRLTEAFPDESWADARVVAWDMWDAEDKAASLAVVDRMQLRTVYVIDRFDEEKRNYRTDSLIPFSADPDSLRVSIPYYFMEPQASHPTYLTYILEDMEYSIALVRDEQNQCMVESLGIFQNEDNTYWTITFQEDHMEIRPATYTRNGYLYGSYERYPLSPSIQAFDTSLAASVIRKACSDYLAGSAPSIPDSSDAYRIPQPCDAKLKAGVYDVYSGPGKEYFREADGKARVSTKDWVQVFGRDGDWVLIQYRVKDSLLRFGYIHQSAFSDIGEVPVLHFEAVAVRQDNQFVTSNPLGKGGDIPLTGQDYPTTRLCTMGDIWMYVELTLPNGEPARMFAEITSSHG